MEKVKLDKVECRYPTLFKVMWVATVVWIVVGVANCMGHWLMPDKLDGFGMSILFMFVISIIVCFRRGLMALASQHGVFAIGAVTRKIASYTMLISFGVLFLLSLWKICGTTNAHTELMRGGAVSVSEDALCAIIVDVFISVLIAIAVVIAYWYVRVCFILFSGRIRRIGVEAALAMLMIWFLSVGMSDSLLVNGFVLLIAGVFLYDIWRFADFQETQFSMSQIKNMVSEEE